MQVLSLVSIYFDGPQLTYNESKWYKTLDYWHRDTLNFDFFKKGLEIVYPSQFVYDFSGKLFLMLYAINWPIWFSDCL